MRERAAMLTFGVALVLFVVLVAIPFVSRGRDQPAAVPDPPALERIALDQVSAGGTICIADVAAERHSEVARMRIGTFGKPGPPLQLTVAGDGYRAGARARGGYADNAVHQFRLVPPRRAQLVRVCVRNRGKTPIALYAAADSARSRARVTIDGRVAQATPTLAFYEERERSIAERVPLTVERIATFRGPLSHAWLIWLVLVVFVVALPLGLGAAIWRDWR